MIKNIDRTAIPKEYIQQKTLKTFFILIYVSFKTFVQKVATQLSVIKRSSSGPYIYV